MNRRSLLRSSLSTAAWLTAGCALAQPELGRSGVSAVAATTAAPAATKVTTGDGTAAGMLDAFVSLYLAEMNCPGLTLGLTGRERTIRTQGYGFSDPAAQIPITPDLLFEIGSITKSFVAIALLQMREEGKLDLDRNVLEYLPWLPIEAAYGSITAHHLLCHTSGLPDALNLFPSDPHERLVQGFKPGEHFHYCNAGFEALGYLIEKLDGAPWQASIRKRLFEPLGMRDSFAVIANDTLHRRARSWVPRYDDQAEGRHAELAPSGAFMFGDAAGSIESTPGDMARYMRMLIGRGQGPSGRILSEESFGLFTKPVIESKELSPTAFYGYGIAIDHLDGHTILRHTGGMASFISSIVVDLDAGFGAFASVNVAHGFRPNPVTLYAVQLLNAEAEKKPLPPRPMLPDPTFVPEAGAYAKIYTAPDGRTIEAVAHGNSLFLSIDGASVPLEMIKPDVFVSPMRPYAKFPFVFTRLGGNAMAASSVPSPNESTAGSKENQPPRPFAELVWGPDWFASSDYQGTRENTPAARLTGYAGHYRAESPWAGSLRVVVRRGRLWVDGTTPLSPIGPGLFRAGAAAWSPEIAAFHHFVDGKPQLLKLSGFDFWRIEAG